MEFFIGYIFGTIVTIFMILNIGVTSDVKVEKGVKIKIGNAVYQCEKKQELDLK